MIIPQLRFADSTKAKKDTAILDSSDHYLKLDVIGCDDFKFIEVNQKKVDAILFLKNLLILSTKLEKLQS